MLDTDGQQDPSRKTLGIAAGLSEPEESRHSCMPLRLHLPSLHYHSARCKLHAQRATPDALTSKRVPPKAGSDRSRHADRSGSLERVQSTGNQPVRTPTSPTSNSAACVIKTAPVTDRNTARRQLDQGLSRAIPSSIGGQYRNVISEAVTRLEPNLHKN